MLRLLSASLLSVLALAGTAAAAAAPHVDDYALRYYASLGQKDRVAAETKRLEALDPSWRVPDDLYAARAGRTDEGPLWDLYAQNRIDAIETAIRERQGAEPGWTPSDDLRAKLKAKATRALVMRLAREQAWHQVVESFKQTGITWAKDDAEALWVIAEAYARENDCSEAFVIYRSILTSHADVAERRATIEHAIAFIPMASTEKLLALGHEDAAGHGEFDTIEADITRARISAYLHDEPSKAVSEEALKRFEDGIRDGADPGQAGLVAWYAYKRQDYGSALDWFKIAIAHGGDAMTAHGLAHTLRKLDRKREAEEVAYAWREPLVNNSILFIDLLEQDFTQPHPPAIEPNRVQRYAQVVVATESGEGAQALAWYAYNTCQYPLALQWFERAMAWFPKEATAYGYALSLQRLHKAGDFKTVVNRYDGLFPKAVALAFDDGNRQPPPACEATGVGSSALSRDADTSAGDGSGPDWTGRTMAETLRPRAIVRRDLRLAADQRALVPSPLALEAHPLRLIKTTEFPVAVSPENPLRFSTLRGATVEDGASRGRVAPGLLVARRVSGVGAMPYERFGFTLLPGYDGVQDASSPTAAERDAPVRTLWALEKSLRMPATVAASQDVVGTKTLRSPAATNSAAGFLLSGSRS